MVIGALLGVDGSNLGLNVERSYMLGEKFVSERASHHSDRGLWKSDGQDGSSVVI
jgi:hypothetical protein